MMTAKDIAHHLASRAESVCRLLLPSGKVMGGNWCVGSIGGERGESLRIELQGAKAGVWADFASGTARGDLLDLWGAVRGVEFKDAFREAKEWLGFPNPTHFNNGHKTYKKPSQKDWNGVISFKDNPKSPVECYLTIDRKLPKATIDVYKVAGGDNDTNICFPYFNVNGKLANIKRIGLKRNEKGKKEVRFVEDCELVLFGWHVIPKDERTIIITEGELDSMTWHSWGFPAMSVPNGALGITWLDGEWENLERFDVIYLSFDMDTEGEKGAIALAKRLGIHRCFLLKLPHKDANECLQKGCTEADARKWIMQSKPLSPKEIKNPSEFLDEIWDMENPDPNRVKPGLVVPIIGSQIRFMPGETTLWTGYSHHGKSSALLQVSLHAALAGERIAIGSFEMRGAQTCIKLSKCAAFKAELSKEDYYKILAWMDGKMWIYNIFGIVTQEKIFELMTYSVMRHGVTQFVLDSLMKCDIASDDYEGQRKFLNRFICFCQEHSVHGHIIGHPHKGDENEPPDMMDVHGSGAVVNQPDNMISVWRHLKKEKESDPVKAAAMPDAYIYVRKQRNTGVRFRVPLYYNHHSSRFTRHRDSNNGPTYEDFGIL